MRLSSFPEWMGRRRARKDKAELLSLSKSHSSHSQSGRNSRNSWFLSLKGICLGTSPPPPDVLYISEVQAYSKRILLLLLIIILKTWETPEDQWRESIQIRYCFAISKRQNATIFTNKTWLGKGSFLIQSGAFLFSTPPPFSVYKVVVTQAENFQKHVRFF